MIIKTIVLTLLFLLYQSNLNVIIKFLIIVDYSVDTEIFVCFYPLISLIQKDDKLYAARGLTYDISYYIGVLIVSLLLGRTIGNYTIDYNTYVISATILMFIAIMILLTINTDKYLKKVKSKGENEILLRLLRKIKKDKISIFYLLFNLFVNIGYFILMGLVLLVLTNVFSLEPFWASNIKLSVGIFAVLIAALILAKFTFKNNYINLSIKFLGRTIMYVMAWIFPNVWTFGIALFYTMVLSSSYTHIADAPYINRFDNDDQLAFANLKEMVTYLSRSIGTYLCGVCLVMGFKYNFILAAVFSFLTTLFAYQALYLYNKEKRGKHGRK
jgi:MFS family permease